MGRKDGKGDRMKAEVTPKHLKKKMSDMDLLPYTCTGILQTSPSSRNFKIGSFGIQVCGRPLISETVLEMSWGHRYGLIGLNGCGKSTMLRVLGKRLAPLPPVLDVYLLDQEIAATDLTVLEAVLEDLNSRVAEIEAEIEEIAASEDIESQDRLSFLYEEIEELAPDLSISRASKILHGLGFDKEMQKKKCANFSGGWRMRIALAKALFVRPSLLLLDEPTNHLDLETCVWLEEYLKNYNRILLVISHSQDFLNSVSTDIIHVQNGNLVFYTGNYDQYVKTRAEKEENQIKRYNWEQDQIRHMKEYIGRFGSGNSKMASQAKSKEKVLAKMESKGLTEKVVNEKIVSFFFPPCGDIPPPALTFNQVSFGYDKDKLLYKNLNFGINLDSRIALVGSNGVGKSTLLKLMVRDLEPVTGQVIAHPQLKIGYFSQHLSDQLDGEISPLKHMLNEFDEETQELRKMIGRFGIVGRDQTLPIKLLSDGVKTRIVFAWLAFRNPHILLFDEPTNHLDIESIDSLAAAINDFNGGVVLVSHDFRLITRVAEELWMCTPTGIKTFQGSIMDYKKLLIENINQDYD